MEEQKIINIDARVSEQNDFIRQVYGWMGMGLLVTAVISFIVSSSTALLNIIFSNVLVFYALILVELGLVIYLSGWVKKMSTDTARIVFVGYSILNGITLSVVFLAYTMSSVTSIFVATAGMFGIISAYGYYTKKDLTTVGNFAFMALVGIILASLVNMFWPSESFSLAISYVAVLVFVALTAYDTQKIKNMNSTIEMGTEIEKKAAIIGALQLYLDFINLFLNLLRIAGRRR